MFSKSEEKGNEGKWWFTLLKKKKGKLSTKLWLKKGVLPFSVEVHKLNYKKLTACALEMLLDLLLASSNGNINNFLWNTGRSN